MSNLATKEGGASVTSATCQDDRHPAAAIIDGNEKTFFYTTGLFPQEVVIAFNKEVTPANIHVVSRHGQARAALMLVQQYFSAVVQRELHAHTLIGLLAALVYTVLQ